MGVLETPITWIVLAAVLVVVAFVLLLVAALRRRRARRAVAAAPPPPAAGHDEEPAGASDPDTAPIDVEAVRARSTTEPAGEPPGEPPGATVQDAEAAKDRLLAVLLRDPRGAVDALRGPDPGAARSATALLQAGLTPAQVARLTGVDEQRLAMVVAQGLGLLEDRQPGSGVTTGLNRTDEPGRSWANTASSAGSTTPTTG
jgi:hypothetical protein